MIKLYHRDVFMPERVKTAPSMTLGLRITRHAEEASHTDRYGHLAIPASITFTGKDIVEAEYVDGRINKIVVRLKYNDTLSAVYACLLDGTLKTVWFNRTDDDHKTLDRSKYATS